MLIRRKTIHYMIAAILVAIMGLSFLKWENSYIRNTLRFVGLSGMMLHAHFFLPVRKRQGTDQTASAPHTMGWTSHPVLFLFLLAALFLCLIPMKNTHTQELLQIISFGSMLVYTLYDDYRRKENELSLDENSEVEE